MTKSDDKRVPALRFKGFTDEWEQRKLGEHIIVSKQKNKNNLSLPAFSISNKNGFIPQEEQFGKDNTYSKTDKSSNYIVKPKYFAYNPARINVGSIAYQNTITPVLVSSLYEIFRSDNNIDDVFLQYWFRSEYFYKQIQRLQEGGVRQYFFIDKMRESQIYLTNVSEQNKIGSLISKLDKLLTLQQRKLKQLKLLKRAMLQTLFTNKSVPQLRFKGFTDNWEQRKLKDQAIIIMGQSPDGSTYSDKPTKYILVQGNADIQNGWVKPRVWTTQLTKLAKKGDILLSVRAPVGKVGRTNYDVVLGRGVAAIKGNNFLFFLFHKLNIDKYWKKYSTGSTFESINSADIRNTIIHIPQKIEQTRIGILVSHIEKQITFQQNKIKKLESLKRFLLQNMFI